MSAVAAPTAELAACRGVSVIHRLGEVEVTALRDIDLRVEVGEPVALRGPSGSGKTTLLHALGGLVVPTEGMVTWKGQPLSSLDVEARSRARAGGIAYVFQGANLLPTFTAYENVSFAAWASSQAIDGRQTRPTAMDPGELLVLVGLATKQDALPSELSGGEAQRAAIARGLAQSPELLLCDEPTGHLDSDTAERVLEMLEALQERFGFALVLATHDAEVAARFGRTVRLADGRLIGEEGA